MKAALIQMRNVPEKQENLDRAARLIREAAENGAELCVLPEMFCCEYRNRAFIESQEPAGGPAWQMLSRAARENRVWLIGGTIPESDGGRWRLAFGIRRVFTCFWLSPPQYYTIPAAENASPCLSAPAAGAFSLVSRFFKTRVTTACLQRAYAAFLLWIGIFFTRIKPVVLGLPTFFVLDSAAAAMPARTGTVFSPSKMAVIAPKRPVPVSMVPFTKSLFIMVVEKSSNCAVKLAILLSMPLVTV